MRRDTPEPALPSRRCETCGGQSPFIYRFEGRKRCRGCLKDCLSHGARGKRRQRLLALLGPEDWAQGEFPWEQTNGKESGD